MKKYFKLLPVILALAVLLVCAVKVASLRTNTPAEALPSAQSDVPEQISPKETPAPAYPDMTGLIVISELMPKNSASVRDTSGQYCDWVEIANTSDSDLSLAGWQLGMKSAFMPLDAYTVKAGQRTVVYIPKAGGSESSKAAFRLKDSAAVKLIDPENRVICEVYIPEAEKDCALALLSDGTYEFTVYPTPGYENSVNGHRLWQESLTSDCPILINEAVTYNIGSHNDLLYGKCDWVELKNCSDETVSLAGYCLSDSSKLEDAQPLPDKELAPGELLLVLCSSDTPGPASLAQDIAVSFSLNSENEDLFLIKDGVIVDSVSLKDIPLGGSYGRLDGEAGFWYFTVPTPGSENSGGARSVASAPEASLAAGIYPAGEELSVELSGEGTIYYTLDTSAPNTGSAVYTEPIVITENTVVRAYSVADGQLPSRSVTFNYLVGAEHDLPVVCVNTDNTNQMTYIYRFADKTMRLPANISYFDTNGSFTTNCTISMNGGTSLELPKKSMLIRLNGAYGMDSLDYDLFGDGQTGLSQLVLRVGQDYYNAVIRNELCQRLALEFSDDVLAQRGKWCVLYLNGEYYGVYALKEDDDSHLYSDRYGVSEDSVVVAKAAVKEWSPVYEALGYILNHDMRDMDNYKYLCENLMDIDSFTDWLVIEGWSSNPDLMSGNMKYALSSEDDGKVRMVFYDLDASLSLTGYLYSNILRPAEDRRNQIYFISTRLLQNEQFRDKFLTRVAEALNTTLSDEHVLELIDEMIAEVDSEMPRDIQRGWRGSYNDWTVECNRLKKIMDGYHTLVIDKLTLLFGLKPDEVEFYFGDLAS